MKPCTSAVLFLLIGVGLSGRVARGQVVTSVSFEQVSWLDENENYDSRYSDWGRVTINYTGTGIPYYFNLVTNGVWTVVNLPLTNREGLGQPHQTAAHFNLGNVPGTPITSLTYLYSVGLQPRLAPPVGVPATAPVTESEYSPGGWGDGEKGSPGAPPAPPAPSPDQKVLDSVSRAHLDPIEQHWNHCVPGAVASSLDWLNKTYGLSFPSTLNDARKIYDVLRDASHMNTSTQIGTQPGVIQSSKEKLFKDNNIPIAVEVNGPPLDGTSCDTEWLSKQIKNGQDVEMGYSWPDPNHPPDGRFFHCVAVQSLDAKKDGSIKVDYVHDRQQKKSTDPSINNGGLGTDNGTITKKPNGDLGFDPGGIDGRIEGFIAESPIIPNVPLLKYLWTHDTAGGPGTENGTGKDEFDIPVWQPDSKTLKVDNTAQNNMFKTVYLVVCFNAVQTVTPDIKLTSSTHPTPPINPTEIKWYNANFQVRFTWTLPDQPAFESIIFPNTNFKNLTGGVKRLDVSFYCRPLTCLTPGNQEPAGGDDKRTSSKTWGGFLNGPPVGFCGTIGDSADPAVFDPGVDIDLIAVPANPGNVLVVWQNGGIDGLIRVFDSQSIANEIAHNDDYCNGAGYAAALAVTLPESGSSVYYVALSGAGNADYNPDVPGSGTVPASDLGPYLLNVELRSGIGADCNGNGVPDDVDIANGCSKDCNGNGIPDTCDIISGFSADTNQNGIPDSCETPPCNHPRYDVDGDGDVDMNDFAIFQRCYTGSGGSPINPLYPISCSCFDWGGHVKNGSIDSLDFSAFQLCGTREKITANPTCDQ